MSFTLSLSSASEVAELGECWCCQVVMIVCPCVSWRARAGVSGRRLNVTLRQRVAHSRILPITSRLQEWIGNTDLFPVTGHTVWSYRCHRQQELIGMLSTCFWLLTLNKNRCISWQKLTNCSSAPTLQPTSHQKLTVSDQMSMSSLRPSQTDQAIKSQHNPGMCITLHHYMRGLWED